MNSALTDTVESVATVLVADDDFIVRQLTCRMLEELGCTVLPAQDGQEAVDIFRAHANEIALVISDVMMPRLNGYEVFAEIRRICPNARVVLVSGCHDQEVGSLEGLTGFLSKPFHMNDLRETLRRALSPEPVAEQLPHHTS